VILAFGNLTSVGAGIIAPTQAVDDLKVFATTMQNVEIIK